MRNLLVQEVLTVDFQVNEPMGILVLHFAVSAHYLTIHFLLFAHLLVQPAIRGASTCHGRAALLAFKLGKTGRGLLILSSLVHYLPISICLSIYISMFVVLALLDNIIIFYLYLSLH